MQRIFSVAAILFFFLASCNSNEESTGILASPPYDKLTDSISRSPKDAGLYYRRGTLLFSNQQGAYAEADIRKAWELQPREEYALSLTSILKQRSPDKAVQFLEEAVQKFPASIALQIGLARGYQQQGKKDKALAVCEELLHQYPDLPIAMTIKSELLQDQHKDREAIAMLEQAYKASPGSADIIQQLAFAYAEANNPKALALSDSLLKIDNRKPEPHYFKGVYYSNTANYKQAVAEFDKAIVNDFNYLDAYINKGIVYYDQKMYDKAMQVFRLVTKIKSNYADAYHWMGKTYEAKGDTANARECFQKAQLFENASD